MTSVARLVTDKMDAEPQNAADARVEQLWQTLDTRKEGQLDINGLKRGLKKMDHRESTLSCLECYAVLRRLLTMVQLSRMPTYYYGTS